MWIVRNGTVVLSFFQWTFIPVFRFWFVKLTIRKISSECTDPVKHIGPGVESFHIVVGYRSTHLSTHSIIVSKSTKLRKVIMVDQVVGSHLPVCRKVHYSITIVLLSKGGRTLGNIEGVPSTAEPQVIL